MRRVVITGYGIVSCLGNEKAAVADSLRQGRSGIQFSEAYQNLGMRSQVAGSIDLDAKAPIGRKSRRFMGNAAAYACISLQQAIEDSGLSEDLVSSPRAGLIMGSGGSSFSDIVEAADGMRDGGLRSVGPFRVPRTMSSTVSACLATHYKIKGINYSISSACATSSHCIGNGTELIQHGKQDIIFAGGGEEEDWSLSMQFDAMGALSGKYNDTPGVASRPYDAGRDGFVIAGGGGAIVLEELEHALRRGAPIYAEIVGYGATSDGADMVAPSGEGAVRCIQQAMENVQEPLDYINTHGTSTPAGDIVELEAIRKIFGDQMPPISSTKSLSGHPLGAAGVHEVIYCLLMMQHGFIAGSANIEALDEKAQFAPIVTETRDGISLRTVLSNSFGFGGTNACLVLQQFTPA